MKFRFNFSPSIKAAVFTAVCLCVATAGAIGRASSDADSESSLDMMIESDRSDLDIPEVYIPSASKLGTIEENNEVMKSQGADDENVEFIIGKDGVKTKTHVAQKESKHRKIKIAQPDNEKFVYTAEGGMHPPSKLCTLFMNSHGTFNAYGRIIRDYIHEELRRDGESRFLSNELIGMNNAPNICPNWSKMNTATKTKFWVWFFAATSFEESDCKATIKDHFDINDYAVSLFQLPLHLYNRGFRGPNCVVSNKAIHSPYSNIRCAMDMIKYQLRPISSGPAPQSGRLCSVAHHDSNSYFYWLRQDNGGEIGRHLKEFAPCRAAPARPASLRLGISG